MRKKRIFLLLSILILTYTVYAQRTVSLKTLWTRQQVHVLFEGYSVSFTIKDIDKALSLLAATGDTTYGLSCKLDTSGNYYTELYSGTKMEYHNTLQPLLQSRVGAFLLSCGHAYIENPKHKKLKEVSMNILPAVGDEQELYVLFYDPVTGGRIFTGKMAAAMQHADLGIE